MSTLVAIAYPDEFKAEAALAKLEELQRQQLILVEDAVIARHQGNKIKLDQALSTSAAGAAGGALWGGLFGLIFLMPVVGLAVGAASGALAGKLADYGVDDNFARGVASSLPPGGAALCVLVSNATPDRVVAEMRQFGGTVLRTNLSTEAEQRLQAAFSGQPSPSSPTTA